jgi:hypothetical protein
MVEAKIVEFLRFPINKVSLFYATIEYNMDGF